MKMLSYVVLPVMMTAGCVYANSQMEAPDLMPVTMKQAPKHAPVTVVKKGQPAAVVYVAEQKPSKQLQVMLDELVEVVRLSTDAKLELAAEAPAPGQPAIIIGACDESREAGIDAEKMPVEGFAVKTAANRVFLVGSTAPLPDLQHIDTDADAWAVADFLERFVGVRWYWPLEAKGRTITRMQDVVIPPVHYTDAPVYRKRAHWPSPGAHYGVPMSSRWFDKKKQPETPDVLEGVEKLTMNPLLTGLRSGHSWPYQTKVHEPQGFQYWKNDQWFKEHEAMFAVNKDGTRSKAMLCYSSQKAVDYLLEGAEKAWDQGKPGASWVTKTYISVSPADEPVNCHCDECQKRMNPDAPQYGAARGEASRVVGLFVKRICEEVKRRWPDKKVMYLPYWNYTLCPEDIDFPDNLEIEMCTSGFAGFRDEQVKAGIEKNLRAWSRKANGKITTWEYSCWVINWTHGPMQFPYVAQEYYRDNREVLAGSFINGASASEWSKVAPTLYVWMRLLWNPDIDVEATLDEMCTRLFGAGAESSRELLRLMIERWENASWSEQLGSAGRVAPAIFRDTWPPDVVEEMKTLYQQARNDMKDDPTARARFDYWTWTFDAFLQEAQEEWQKAAGNAGTEETEDFAQ